MIFKKDNCLIYQYDNETVQIEPVSAATKRNMVRKAIHFFPFSMTLPLCFLFS